MKSKYAVVTYWIVIFLIESYQVVQSPVTYTKTPLQLLAKIKKFYRKESAGRFLPPGFIPLAFTY